MLNSESTDEDTAQVALDVVQVDQFTPSKPLDRQELRHVDFSAYLMLG